MSASSSPLAVVTGAGSGIGYVNALITELKTRARLGLNAVHEGDLSLVARAQAASGRATAPPREWRLRDCLSLVAIEVGFASWDQARRVLGGQAAAGDDAGTFWHSPRCNGLLNHWFASVAEARVALATSDHRVLLPYRRQFVVVDENYLREIGVPMSDAHWSEAGRDLVAAYGSEAWLELSRLRLLATRAVPPPRSG